MLAMQVAASDAVVVGVAAVLVLAVLVWAWLFRRSTIRRLASLTTRLADEGADELVFRGGMERNLGRLERAAEQAVTDLGSARLAGSRLDFEIGPNPTLKP